MTRGHRGSKGAKNNYRDKEAAATAARRRSVELGANFYVYECDLGGHWHYACRRDGKQPGRTSKWHTEWDRWELGARAAGLLLAESRRPLAVIANHHRAAEKRAAA